MIVVISKDKDFSSALSEQLERELKMPCRIAGNEEETAPWLVEAEAVITTEPSMKFSVPHVVIKETPIRLQRLLDDIKAMTSASKAAEPIGAFRFQPLKKRLVHAPSGKTAALTDKEARLLLALAAGGEKGRSRDSLLKDIWGVEEPLNTHTLETHIYRLRGKFKEISGEETIAACDGGYRLEL